MTALPTPTTTAFPANYITRRVAGTSDAASSDTTGPPLSASFANIMGLAISNDGDTLYVLEGYNTNAPATAACWIRKLTGLREPPSTAVGGVWANVPGAFLSVSCGQILVGPVTGNIYIAVQTALLASTDPVVGYCNIAFFYPDGAYGGLVLDNDVTAIGGFTLRADETAIYYAWTADEQSGNWGDIKIGRKLSGQPQADDYTHADQYIYGAPEFGPYGGFQGASGVWLDSATGCLYLTSTGAFSNSVCRLKVEPAVDPSSAVIDPFGWPRSGPSSFYTAYRGIIGGSLLGPGSKPFVATIDSAYPNLYVGDTASFAATTIGLPAADSTGGAGPSGESYGGGYPTIGNGRLYYHTPGAIYELLLSAVWQDVIPIDGAPAWSAAAPWTKPT